MVLRLKTRESRSLPGLPRAGSETAARPHRDNDPFFTTWDCETAAVRETAGGFCVAVCRNWSPPRVRGLAVSDGAPPQALQPVQAPAYIVRLAYSQPGLTGCGQQQAGHRDDDHEEEDLQGAGRGLGLAEGPYAHDRHKCQDCRHQPGHRLLRTQHLVCERCIRGPGSTDLTQDCRNCGPAGTAATASFSSGGRVPASGTPVVRRCEPREAPASGCRRTAPG